MRCIRVRHAAGNAACVAAMLALWGVVHKAKAQTSPPPAYRLPALIVAAPADGAPLPEDKPVAVLRFASVEPTDPIDALSFSVAVDGKDKTSLFQATQDEAWGPLVGPGETLTLGQHDLAARICTSHGACVTTKATVTVVAGASGLITTTKADSKQKKSKIFDAVVQAIRMLFR
ncbi:MAG TPA: hypothetical protein VE110_12110 [Gemmatimonadaceae bacterium]|nr:hypothetical protein [Gemmatimonadaceae bacterium]